MNRLKQALAQQDFVCVLEVIPQPSARRWAALEQILQHGQLAGAPLLPAFADRVGLHHDISPLAAAGIANDPASTLLHFSGKDRERSHLLQQMAQMDQRGLRQLLVLSGDRLPGHQPGQTPVRYLESVPALQIAREYGPDWLLGAALNPFKYLEEERAAQYLKAQKKLRAGADFLTLQLGYDAAKHLEAQHWMAAQPQPKPLLACVMKLTSARAATLQSVPGIVITDAMRRLLDDEQRRSPASAEARALERLAMQIIGLQWIGYAGIHLSGVHTLEELRRLEQAIEVQREGIRSLSDWQHRWRACWQHADGRDTAFTPPLDRQALGQPDARATGRELRRYRWLAQLHRVLFDRRHWLGSAFGWLVTRQFWQSAAGAQLLHATERAVKRPLLGCDSCGNCRLEDTLYVCPETCPKGLANGPCGGTHLNRCEFGDRECIHSVKYRLAKATDQLPQLAQTLIPCINADDRHRSSWPRWFEEEDSRSEQ